MKKSLKEMSIIMDEKDKNVTYILNVKKKSVTCFLVSKGEQFVGVAVCSHNDNFDLEVGKKISKLRAEIAQRKADLATDALFASGLQEYLHDAERDGVRTSKLVMQSIQSAHESMKIQREHINICYRMIAEIEAFVDNGKIYNETY